MLRSIGRFVGTPAVVVTLFFGIGMVIVAATRDSQAVQLVAAFVAVLLVFVSLAMLFVVFIKRLNADIDSERHDLRRELDALVEDDEK
ncbi:hypothetical protein [Halorientalis halophila]|uniref:hypothetical protein n=1 Tax=Halorientalis halophila TaxID=3108499 RepID=UPI003009B92B